MATIAQLLHHLLDHAPGLSGENRAAFREAIDDAAGGAGDKPDPAEPDPAEPAAGKKTGKPGAGG